jgi:phosphoglycolate phosphatase
MSKKVFLFDLDWTLVYTGGAGLRALTYAFEKHCQVPEGMKNISPDGKTDPAIVREMIRVHLQREPQPGEIDAICRGYVDRLKIEVKEGPGYKVLPGIPELLAVLSKRPDVILGLGTGNLEEGARAKLGRADLMRFFQFGGYSNDSEDRPKVLGTAVQRAEALLGEKVPPRDVIVIGDNFRDIQAGQAIGATTVGVASGPMSYDSLAAYHPDYLFHDLSHTQDVLERLLPGVPEHR